MSKKIVRVAQKQRAQRIMSEHYWGNIGLFAPIVILTGLNQVIRVPLDSSVGLQIVVAIVPLFTLIFGTYANYVALWQSLRQIEQPSAKPDPVKSYGTTYLTAGWIGDLLKSIAVNIIFVLPWYVLMVVVVMFMSVLITIITGIGILNGLMVWLFLWIIGSFFMLPVVLSYAMVPYIMFDNRVQHHPRTIFDTARLSRKMMYGHRWEFIVMSLSFFGWIVLSLFTLGIALFYVQPYIGLTTAGYYLTWRNQLEENQVQIEVLYPKI